MRVRRDSRLGVRSARMARKMGFHLAVLLISAMLFACASGDGSSELRACFAENQNFAGAEEYSSRYLEIMLRSKKLTGIAVSVASPEGVLYSNAHGKATPDKPFTVDTLTPVASISKLFTATAIMRLVEAGLVDLDAPLSRYLEDFKPRSSGFNPDGVTIRAMLAHQSGLISDYYGPGFMPLVSWKNQSDKPYADLVRLVSETALCQAPYTISAYSNVGFALLGLVVEKVSGKSFYDYVRETILLPAGMRDSGFVYRQEFDARYTKGQRGKAWVEIMGIPDAPAGALVSSAHEIGAFMSAVLKTHAKGLDGTQGGIMRPKTLERMWTQENTSTALDFGSVQMLAWYGIDADDGTGRQFYGHGGDIPGFHAMLMIDPETDLGVTLMVNSDAMDSIALIEAGRELLHVWAIANQSVLATLPGNAGTGAAASESTSLGLPKALKPSAEQRAFLVGNWASPLGLFRITSSGTSVFLDFMGVPLELLSVGQDSYIAKAKILRFFPVSHPLVDSLTIHAHRHDGKNFLAIDANGMRGLVMEQIDFVSLPPAWLERLGTWRITNAPEGDYLKLNPQKLELFLDKASGLYCLKIWRADSFMMFPVASRTEDSIYLRGYGRGLGEAFFVETDAGTESLRWLGYRFVRE